jgi:hypothetical protein
MDGWKYRYGVSGCLGHCVADVGIGTVGQITTSGGGW